MSSHSIRLLVMSDLHVVTETGPSDTSYLSFADGQSHFADCTIEFLRKQGKTWDMLICPGDITDKADHQNFENGWRFINRAATELEIPKIVAVPGNHDHHSRLEKTKGADPKILMQYATPPFPSPRAELNEHFWAWRWSHEATDSVNIIQIDTSAFHGYNAEERDHGRIHAKTRRHLVAHVTDPKYKKKPLNLVVCHHHPMPYPIVPDSDDFQAMVGGAQLILELSESGKGPWFLIHGHIHTHYIYNAQSTTSEPPVLFSAGTIAHKSQDRGPQNQLHSIEIDLTESENNGSPYGTFQTWEYSPTVGWYAPSGNPPKSAGGFGSPDRPTKLAKEISDRLGSDEQLNTADWQEIEASILHLIPGDLKRLVDSLSGYRVELAVDGDRIVGVKRI